MNCARVWMISLLLGEPFSVLLFLSVDDSALDLNSSSAPGNSTRFLTLLVDLILASIRLAHLSKVSFFSFC